MTIKATPVLTVRKHNTRREMMRTPGCYKNQFLETQAINCNESVNISWHTYSELLYYVGTNYCVFIQSPIVSLPHLYYYYKGTTHVVS